MDGLQDGVEVPPFVGPADGSMSKARDQSEEGKEAIVRFLHSYNWEALPSWPVNEKHELVRDPAIIPPGAVRILVGLYPSIPLTPPPGAKDFTDVTARQREIMERHRRETAERQAKIEEQITKNLSPEEAEDFKARSEALRKEEEKREELYINPCQSSASGFPWPR